MKTPCFRPAIKVVAALVSLQLGSAAHAAVVLDYRFETNNGSVPTNGAAITRLDDTGLSHYNGTAITGTPTYSSNVPGSVIDPGSLTNTFSGNFDGTAQISAGTNVNLVGTGSFTIEAFVRRPTSYVGTNAPPMGIINNGYNANTAGWTFLLDDTYNGSKLSMSLLGSDDVFGGHHNYSARLSGANETLLSDTNWHHVAVVVDRTNNVMQLYIDYMQAGSDDDISAVSGSLDPGPNTAALLVGTSSSNTYFFNGNLDEIRISNAALTPSQFLQAVPEPGVVQLLLPAIALATFLTRKRR